MLIDSLPLATPYDPAEDLPSGIAPLGKLATSEQLADVLLPGLTARMWRTRHLTFTALTTPIQWRDCLPHARSSSTTRAGTTPVKRWSRPWNL